MGRRALRKIDPALDLSRHYRVLEQLQTSWNPRDWYGRAAPLEIEVGSGKGLFLTSAAAATPEHDYLGIELARKYARFSAARAARTGLANAVVLQGDAQRFLAQFVATASVYAVHIYFPDPWWKKKHRKRRIMNPAFLRDVHRILCADGQLHFWTDVESYYLESLELLRELGGWTEPLPIQERAAEHDLDYHTHFERRMRLHNRPVYRAEFGKRTDPGEE